MTYDGSFRPTVQCIDNSNTLHLILKGNFSKLHLQPWRFTVHKTGKQRRLQSLEGLLPLLCAGPCCSRSALDSLSGGDGGGRSDRLWRCDVRVRWTEWGRRAVPLFVLTDTLGTSVLAPNVFAVGWGDLEGARRGERLCGATRRRDEGSDGLLLGESHSLCGL